MSAIVIALACAGLMVALLRLNGPRSRAREVWDDW